MDLSLRRTLGRSGLPVSPLALGTMTFGNKGWGSSDDVSRTVFDAYVEAGGNFIDTADVYGGGRSEELTGSFITDGKLRDRIVLATKYSFSGGNGRKNLYRAVEGSLKRMQTDYIDLYWVHVWDAVTPAEELLQSLGNLVRSGKIRYFGLSDVPAWYAARMSTLAQTHNIPGPIALQLVYSLVERIIECEHIPAARDLGLGITPWSPLGAGFLTGKYRRDKNGNVAAGGGRLDSNNQPFRMFTDRNWKILDTLTQVSRELEKPMSQVALAWALQQPGITSLIIGATKLDQLKSNIASLDISLSPVHLETLQKASASELMNFYTLFGGPINRGIFGGATVQGWFSQNH